MPWAEIVFAVLGALGGGGAVTAYVSARGKRAVVKAQAEGQVRVLRAQDDLQHNDWLRRQFEQLRGEVEELREAGEELRRAGERWKSANDECQRNWKTSLAEHKTKDVRIRQQDEKIQELGTHVQELKAMILRDRADVTSRIELAAEKVAERR